MCMAAAWVSRAASAAHTQESIPPLNKTTDLKFLLTLHHYRRLNTSLWSSASLSVESIMRCPFPITRPPQSSNAFRRRLPDELVNLQAQPDVQLVLHDPLCQ